MPRKVLTNVVPEQGEDGGIQVELSLPVRRRILVSTGSRRPVSASNPPNRRRIPRITRLMALAIKFQQLVDRGEVVDYADLARLGYVTRARLTQIMNLLLLAPDIQEAIVEMGQETTETKCAERQVRSVVKLVRWDHQRKAWAAMFS